ncbi:uncharacterized protein HMPREF1541_08843 [Cyphellophora europaea CBS 101466]|uniref:CFEM domain-containing protein n=1 Tax=Cyphellophora europaea (strain CBS 101466) TaxID=1220924 RepID=W2RJP3_CYPE1|nr:uncharacterized protein HMPREF1541_08843 [Cyphellophora europaea CBS 101466]ETN36565.1 hypothetical protein HMPREF1541_08843 [Cyphellophora europaea CBS 101466]
MYRSYLPLLAVISAAIAAPQSSGLEGLSPCAQSAALLAIGSTNCQATDTACLCTGTAFQDAVKAGIATRCGDADVTATEEWGKTFCANAGVPVPSSSATAAEPDTASEPGTVEATSVPTATSTSWNDYEGDTAPANTTTTWVNGTCHRCDEGQGDATAPSNNTAPNAPAPTPPVETCTGGCQQPGSASGNSSAPKYTGAASQLVPAAFSGAAAVAALFALL